MLVFGDRVERLEPRQLLERLRDEIATLGANHADGRTAALIDAGMLAQGLADADFAARGQDEPDDRQGLALALVCALADDRDFDQAIALQALKALAGADLPDELVCKTPEGFLVYGVFPQAFRAAAATARLNRPFVIGLRSIGTTLGAAAAVGAVARDFVTLRPCGEVFARRIQAAPALRARLAAHDGDFLVVDEGPGLSGSSFGAVGDLLTQSGVAENRVVFMPSHDSDPGSRASVPHRQRWSRARRAPATLDGVLEREPIANWFEDLTGPLQSVEDLSAAAWRAELPPGQRPPVWRLQERRKFRLTGERGVFLARFAGLGRIGDAKLALAKALHGGGFTPEPLALRRGFLLERWIPGAPLATEGADRPVFLEHLGAYLAFRDGRAPPGSGANGAELREMAKTNIRRLGGDTLWQALEKGVAAERLVEGARPLAIDGRLHPWEWRRDRQGRIWKADALDHAYGHDLVGCQDIAWDIAGARVEFTLSPPEATGLAQKVGSARGRAFDPQALRAFEIAYCAFQAGLWTYAAEEAQEAQAARARVDFYRRRLIDLAAGRVATFALG